MTRLHHTCGQAIDFMRRDNGLSYDAVFVRLDDRREITSCPKCSALLYSALCFGELADVPGIDQPVTS